MRYEVFGEFDVPRTKRLVDKSPQALRAFWEQASGSNPGLADAVGCYVFCIGKKPWYVGLAERQTFRRECFQPHKLVAYASAMSKVKTGKPKLILLAKMTPKGKFAKPGVNGHRATRFLEDLLIGMALSRNPKLENARGTKFMKQMVVPGVLNTPQGKSAAKSVKALRSVMQA